MKKLAPFAVLFVCASTLAQACTAEPPDDEETIPEKTDTAQQADVIRFGAAIVCVGLNPFRFNGYGCFCGMGNSGDDHTPIDPIDAVCKIHDACYDTGIEGCNCLNQAYNLTCTDGNPTCDANQPNACATACCACDVAAANGFRDTNQYYNSCYKNFDWSNCREDPTSCESDQDCLSSQRCVDGACVLEGEDPPCLENGDCPSGYYCNSGICAPVCSERIVAVPKTSDAAL